jgi:phosphatidylserine/phosphatidylglycerophosphate/cardiolipin synthase-like enzyme
MFKKIKRSNYLHVLLCILSAFFFVFASKAGDVESIEVVTTIPVETVLKNEGTRSAADTWVAMIDSAKETLDFAEFYLSTKKGEPLEPVIDSIINAANRGVNVRFLVGRPVNDEMKARTLEVLERFNNTPRIAHVFFNGEKIGNGNLHAKYFIVDHRELFVGSQNFDWRSLKHIHETGLRIRSRSMAGTLTRIFETDWRMAQSPSKGDAILPFKGTESHFDDHFLVAGPEKINPPGVVSALKILIKLIDGAEKKITVQLLSFDEEIGKSTERFTIISDALKRAAGRGVAVHILVSDWNKRKPAVDDLKHLVRVPGIEIKFATIPPSGEGFIPYARVVHSKVLRIDKDLSWVGTSNWGYGYFYTSRNVEVVTHDPSIAQTLDRLFISLWNSPYTYPVEPGKEYEPPAVGK